MVLLDQVTDPHNVGAVLRSAEVFGARAVIATLRNSAPETGALAKTASGALERQPYLRVTNLADAMEELRAMGYMLIGLDGDGTVDLAVALADAGCRAVALVLGAEGPGLRDKTRETCDVVAKIQAEVDELRDVVDAPGVVDQARAEEEMGDLLFSIAQLSRRLGIEPETALRKADDKFTQRFGALEQAVTSSGRTMKNMALDELEAEWQRLKSHTHAE